MRMLPKARICGPTLAFQNPEFKIFTEFKILAVLNSEGKVDLSF